MRHPTEKTLFNVIPQIGNGDCLFYSLAYITTSQYQGVLPAELREINLRLNQAEDLTTAKSMRHFITNRLCRFHQHQQIAMEIIELYTSSHSSQQEEIDTVFKEKTSQTLSYFLTRLEDQSNDHENIYKVISNVYIYYYSRYKESGNPFFWGMHSAIQTFCLIFRVKITILADKESSNIYDVNAGFSIDLSKVKLSSLKEVKYVSPIQCFVHYTNCPSPPVPDDFPTDTQTFYLFYSNGNHYCNLVPQNQAASCDLLAIAYDDMRYLEKLTIKIKGYVDSSNRLFDALSLACLTGNTKGIHALHDAGFQYSFNRFFPYYDPTKMVWTNQNTLFHLCVYTENCDMINLLAMFHDSCTLSAQRSSLEELLRIRNSSELTPAQLALSIGRATITTSLSLLSGVEGNELQAPSDIFVKKFTTTGSPEETVEYLNRVLNIYKGLASTLSTSLQPLQERDNAAPFQHALRQSSMSRETIAIGDQVEEGHARKKPRLTENS